MDTLSSNVTLRETSVLLAAAAYALDGLSVFPCEKKIPLTGTGGFKNASLDAAQILKWWTENPWAQIGIPTGQINNLFVLDIDGPEGERVAAKMNLPETFTVATRPGRYQFWFRQPEGMKSKCTASVIAPQLDTRGDGGYIVAPPSIHHETGKPYQIVKNLPWAPAPLDLLDPQKSVANGSGTKPREVSGPIPRGQRHTTLLSLAGSMAKRALPDSVIRTALRDINQNLAKPPLADSELEKMIAYVSGKKPPTVSGEAVMTCIAEVQRVELDWLWKKRFPLGKVSVLAGDPGLGKSVLTLDFAARVSCGRAWPNGDPCQKGSVIILSAEDDAGDTIRPRLEAARADLKKIHILKAVRVTHPNGDTAIKYFNLGTDIAALETAIFSLDDVRLIILDPISSYLGTAIDARKNAEVRSILNPLVDLAATARATVLAVTHLNKGSGPALYRVMDSVAFVAAGRSAWLVAKNRENPAERMLLPGKSNLGPDDASMGFTYTLKEKSGAVTIEWGGSTDATADSMLEHEFESHADQSLRTEAGEWLLTQLADGPQSVTDLQTRAKNEGFSWRTVQRARYRLPIKPRKSAMAGGWAWTYEPKAAGERK